MCKQILHVSKQRKAHPCKLKSQFILPFEFNPMFISLQYFSCIMKMSKYLYCRNQAYHRKKRSGCIWIKEKKWLYSPPIFTNPCPMPSRKASVKLPGNWGSR